MASTALSRDPAPAAAPDRHLLFGVNGRVYGCEIALVREIVPFRRCTRLPGAPAHVCGLINLRGTVVTVLDLGLRLGGGPADRNDGSVVLVEQGGRLVGLAVDEMRDVQPLARGGAEGGAAAGARPAGGDAGGAVRGVVRVGAQVVVLLDVVAIIKQALL